MGVKKSAVGRVAIFGPGLIGGSITLALRSYSPQTKINVWGRKKELLQEILDRNLADLITTDPAEAVADANLIVLCTPVGVMAEIAERIIPHLKSDAIVTDAGSVKSCVVSKLSPLLGSRFVGGHPMAGSERSGFAAARADLLNAAPCILTPVENTSPEALQVVTDFWTLFGARVTTMSPQEHDLVAARLSHLPHAVAFALVNLASTSLPARASDLAGGSYRDGTRVAASDPLLWTGILTENRTEVSAALRDLSELLCSLAQNLEEGNEALILDFLTRAKEHRDRLPLPSPDEPFMNSFTVQFSSPICRSIIVPGE